MTDATALAGKHQLRPLKNNSRLDTAGRRHTKVMLKKDCFEHRCPAEPPLGKRPGAVKSVR